MGKTTRFMGEVESLHQAIIRLVRTQLAHYKAHYKLSDKDIDNIFGMEPGWYTYFSQGDWNGLFDSHFLCTLYLFTMRDFEFYRADYAVNGELRDIVEEHIKSQITDKRTKIIENLFEALGVKTYDELEEVVEQIKVLKDGKEKGDRLRI